MIDVPIGLCDGVRPVDLGAERVTSRWNPRAFLSPARCAVTAGDWAEADRLNRAATGSGLSRRAWAIVPRIRATDECLRSHPSARRAVREVHPEVCFRALAGRPPAAGEKTPAGLAERLAPPEPLVPGARALMDLALASWPRSVLAADDAVDALAALAVALAPDADLRALTGGTGPTPLDPHGPPMEMVYRSAAR
jgi:predicted RNase H-like nuclease